MVLVSVLNNALKVICNAERVGKRQVLVRPSSKVVIKFLQVMMKHRETRLCPARPCLSPERPLTPYALPSRRLHWGV